MDLSKNNDDEAGPASNSGPASSSSTDSQPSIAKRVAALDRRTISIALCAAVICAIVAALVVTVTLKDDDSSATDASNELTLSPPGDIDADRLLSVAMRDTAGKTVSLKNFTKGKPLLVNIWKQDCVPCITEMPMLEEVSQANPDVDFLGVDVFDKLPKAKVMAERTGITYPWVQDPNGMFLSTAEATGLPVSLLLDANGNVVANKLGEFKSLDEIQAFLDDNL